MKERIMKMKKNVMKRSLAALLGLTLMVPQMLSNAAFASENSGTDTGPSSLESEETGSLYLDLTEGGDVRFELKDGSRISFMKNHDGNIIRTKGKKTKILDPDSRVKVYEGPAQEEIEVSVIPDDHHETGKVKITSEESAIKVKDNPSVIRLESGDQTVSVSFEERPSEEESSEDGNAEDDEDADQPAESETEDASDPSEEASEETSEEETAEEDEPVFGKPADDSPFSQKELKKMDFSSKRLLVAGNEDLILDPEHVLSSYEGVFLLQYEDEEMTRNAFSYYYGKADFVDVDGTVSVAEGDQDGSGPGEMTEEENPLAELAEAIDENPGKTKGTVIALIDTGVNDMTQVVEAVSMMGDDPSDGNGHGTKMAEFIHEINPEAKILSVKALGADGSGDASAVYAAIQYAISRDVTIINLSVSAAKKTENAAVEAAVQEAVAKGILVAGAAGNKNKDAKYYVPGCLADAYILGACDEHGQRISSSNYGNTVDFNVVAESTSEAAAKFSGYLSLGETEADEVLVFPTDYEYTGDSEEPEEDGRFYIAIGPNQEPSAPSSTIKLSEYLGISGDDIVARMKSHEKDTYYKTTPYQGTWNTSDPYFNLACNGDPNTVNGTYAPGMNCTGFVSRVLVDVMGGNGHDSALRNMCSWVQNNTSYSAAGSFVNASNYNWFAVMYRSSSNAGIEHYWYKDIDSLVNGNAGGFTYGGTSVPAKTYVPQKGDIIFCEVNRDMYDDGSAWGWGSFDGHTDPEGNTIDVHIGYYWGSKKGENKWWHSAHSGNGVAAFQMEDGSDSGNGVSNIAPKCASIYMVIPMGGHEQEDVDLTIHKSSGNTDVTDGNSQYDMTGIQYTVYTNSGCTTVAKDTGGNNAVFTLKKNGTANTVKLEPGKYWIKETFVPEDSHYKLSDTVYSVTLSDTAVDLAVTDFPETGSFYVQKESTNPSVTDGNSKYDTTGIVYRAYSDSDCSTRTKDVDGKNITLTLDKDGKSNTVEVAYGSYWIKEYSVPADSGYEKSDEVRKVTINAENSSKPVKAPMSDPPETPSVKVKKESSNTTVTDGNSSYNMTGIRYRIYTDSDCTTRAKDKDGKTVELILDDKGTSDTVDLGYGKYWMKEYSVPAGSGYILSGTAKSFTLDSESPKVTTVSMTDPPLTDTMGLVIHKVDENGKTVNGVDMSGAEYTIRFYAGQYTKSGLPSSPSAAWVIRTVKSGNNYTAVLDDSHKVSGDSAKYGKGSDGRYVIPLGTVTIEETNAPSGFGLEGSSLELEAGNGSDAAEGILLVNLTESNHSVIVKSGNQTDDTEDGVLLKSKEEILKGGLSVPKHDRELKTGTAQGDASLNGIRFAVINATGHEVVNKDGKTIPNGNVVQVITTNASGKASTGTSDLPFGRYTVIELKQDASVNAENGKLTAGVSELANDSYLWSDYSRSITIDEADKITPITDAAEDGSTHGSGSVTKKVTGTDLVTEGDATPAGIRIAIVNRSANVVVVNNAQRAKGQVVQILTLNAQGKADTVSLPYGSYQGYELRSDATITVGEVYDDSTRLGTSIYANSGGFLYRDQNQTFTIRRNGESKVMNFEDPLVTGYGKVLKKDSDTGTISQGDASPAGIRFAIVNDSAGAVIVKGALRGKGQVTEILTLNAQGEAVSGDLPYGTYKAYELRSDATITAGETYTGSSKLGTSIYANSAGYLFKDQSRSFTIRTQGETKTLEFSDKAVYGSVKIEKWDKELKKKAAQGDADFTGIRFEIRNAGKQPVVVEGKVYAVGDVVKTLTTDAAGDAASGKVLPYGTYTIRETATNGSYQLTDGTQRTFVIRKEGETVRTDTRNNSLHFDNIPVRGGLAVQKDDRERETGKTQGDADLSGIRFAVVNNSEKDVFVDSTVYAPGQVVMLIGTDSKGMAATDSDALPYGTYHVYELRADAEIASGDVYEGSEKLGESIYANDSYLFAENDIEVKVTENDKIYPVSFENDVVRGGVRGGKIDRETGDNEPQGWASLEGAEITIYNDSQEAVMVDGREYQPGEAVAVLTTDAEGYFESSADLLPYGTYFLKETKAPEGYLLNGEWTASFTIRENGAVVDCETDTLVRAMILPDEENGIIVPDDIIRGDLSFMKLDIDGNPMPGIPFVIERLDMEGNVVESHVIVSDENGVVSTGSRSKTDEKVNSLDEYMTDDMFTDESRLDGTAGVWFGEQSARDDTKGALLYADYQIRELQCEANKGQDLLKTIEPVSIRKDGIEIALSGALVDLNIYLESEAMDAVSESKVVTSGTEVELKDTVSYIHLKVYNDYELVTAFYNIRKDGRAVKLGEGSARFTPEKTDNTNTAYGEITNSVKVDTTKAEPGSFIAAVGELYKVEDGSKILIASHNTDYSVKSQKLYVPEIRTEASDVKTKDHVGSIEDKASVADILMYSNLADQKMYLVVAKLRDAGTGEEVADPVSRLLRINYGDSEVTNKMLYWQGPKDGTLEMPDFVFDTFGVEGKTLVVTETLTEMDSGEIVLTHEDLADQVQQVRYIRVRTEASDDTTKSHVGTVDKEVTVTDHVTIENAIVGEAYVITGTLVYQEDCTDSEGKEHKAGEVIAEHEPVEVTAEDTMIEKDLRFTMDASKLEGLSGVVFEDVYHNNVLVGTHHNIHSRPQTICWPKVLTTASDSQTGTHTGVIGEQVSIKDEVLLTNLIPGETYRVQGTLKDSEGNDFLVEGLPLVEEQEFTAESEETTLTMEFTFNSSELNGKSLVVFEKLFTAGVEVARHEDREDKGQTISYPDGKTNAVDSSTKDQVGVVGDQETITDTVEYRNLVAGETYEVKGQLMYKEAFTDIQGTSHKAGDPVLSAEGKPITAATKFTAEQPEGTVDLVYTLDSTLITGASVVVFEDFYSNGVKVFSHADLEDKDQTVWYPFVRTTAVDVVTEDHVGTTGRMSVIRDVVELKNLKIGEKYKVYGTLMDRETGEAVREIGKEIITAESDEFVAESSEMTITLDFTLDAGFRPNRTTVVFEELIHAGVTVAVHADIDDESQSVHHPAIHTTAADKETGEHVGRTRKKTVIQDTVKLYNLLPGMTYEVEGYLVDSVSGKPYLDADGNEVRVHSDPFVAEKGKENTEILMTFTFNGTNLDGRSVTVYEDLYHRDHVVAAHRQNHDIDQMVDYPDIHTTAADGKTRDHITNADETVTIVDEVTYENLRPELTYKVRGTLMNKTTGKELLVDGKTITAEKEFTPKKKDGSIELEFAFDASALAGETVVVFEDVFYNDIEVAVHHDLEDDDQTVVIPSVRTSVKDKVDGDRKVLPGTKVTLVDTVHMENLLPGRKYCLHGRVMNKKTGEVFMSEGKLVEAVSKVFNADQPDLDLDLEFTFAVHGVEDTDLVVFESLYLVDDGSEVMVGTHEDWGDQEQTVHVEKSPQEKPPKTGDKTIIIIPVITMIISVVGIILVYLEKRKLIK